MKTVLIVDDSKTMLMSLESVLKHAGFEVHAESSGASALDWLERSSRPDLVITDLNMPQMDGVALIRKIRAIASLRFVPVLMLTTESQQEKRQEARNAGATGWMVKPVQPDQLCATIDRVLPKR